MKNSQHAPLKNYRCIAKSKWHPSISKGVIWASESSLLLVLWGYMNLIVAQVTVKETVISMACYFFQQLIHERKWEMVLASGIIEFSVINAHPPSYDCAVRNQFIVIILHHYDSCNTLIAPHYA